jgi:hypothetical protein
MELYDKELLEQTREAVHRCLWLLEYDALIDDDELHELTPIVEVLLAHLRRLGEDTRVFERRLRAWKEEHGMGHTYQA